MNLARHGGDEALSFLHPLLDLGPFELWIDAVVTGLELSEVPRDTAGLDPPTVE